MKMTAQDKSESLGRKDTESHSGPAHGGDTVVEQAGSSTGSPSPESRTDSRAEAEAK